MRPPTTRRPDVATHDQEARRGYPRPGGQMWLPTTRRPDVATHDPGSLGRHVACVPICVQTCVSTCEGHVPGLWEGSRRFVRRPFFETLQRPVCTQAHGGGCERAKWPMEAVTLGSIGPTGSRCGAAQHPPATRESGTRGARRTCTFTAQTN